MMNDNRYIKKQVRKLMKVMDYMILKAEKKNANPIYYEAYNLLGGYAWAHLCECCEHEFKVSKKYPTGHCKVCGQVGRDYESKTRIRK